MIDQKIRKQRRNLVVFLKETERMNLSEIARMISISVESVRQDYARACEDRINIQKLAAFNNKPT